MLALLALLLTGPSLAQSPDDRWRTVETEQFRVHYPVQAEEWALDAAAQLDSIRARVADAVGFRPTQKVDVLIVDPYTQANGSAWPFLESPRMLLWATPPESDSVIGNYRSWSELLLVHEDAHLVHLLRPSRNPLVRGVDALLGVGPVARKSPRWVIEGYATVIEARLTGYGRPQADFRALLLRELAREGRLPTYRELNGVDRFHGYSFAYLVGSAYLEWLEERGPGTLPDVWARLSARKQRRFDDAFAGVFGAPPATLYGRFTAELTHAALEIERDRPVEEGTRWMNLQRSTGAPVVSPDGEKLAAVVWRKDKPPKLVVWSTAVDEEALEAREKAIAEVLAQDPEDVAPVPPDTLPHKVLHEREHWTILPVQPRWMPDGAGLLFTAWLFDGDGRMRPDLFLWDPEAGEERRITRRADVRNADPAPDGSFAVAVQHDWGRTRLVQVTLSDGAIEPLTAFDVDVIYDEPRLSPDGGRLAWLEHRGEGWDVVIRDLNDGTVTRLVRGGPAGPTYAQLAWSADGQRLFASVGEGGFVEVRELVDDTGPRDQVTRSRGGAFAPAPTPDGEGLFYLSLDAEGLDIHRVDLEPRPEVPLSEVPDLPVVRPQALDPVPEPPDRLETLEPSPYGLGRTELRPLVGFAASPSQSAVEVGLRAGDLIGRRDLLLMGSYGGEAGVTGLLLGATYRGLPIDPVIQGFLAAEGVDLMQRFGVAGRLERDLRGHVWYVGLTAGAWADSPMQDRITRDRSGLLDGDLIPEGVVVRATPNRGVGWAQARGSWTHPSGTLTASLRARGQLGVTGGDDWWRGEGTVVARIGRRPGVIVAYTLGTTTATWGLDRYRLGGVPSAVLPEAWQWSRITSPGFDAGMLRGQDRDELRVAWDSGTPLQLFAERHRMGDDGLPRDGATLVGLEASLSLDEQPFARLPRIQTRAGVGCLLERPEAGWAGEPCTTLDDLFAWATATWRL